MTWAEVHWRSDVLQKDTTLQVLIPQVGNPPYPTLYLLHSLKDDSHAWMRKTRLESVVESLPLIVVMPDGYRGFFTDNLEGPAFAKHIGEEVPHFVEKTFPARPDRAARAIGGASMGGYGALRVGLAYADSFCSIHSHAGSFDSNVEFKPNDLERSGILQTRPEAFISEMRRIFGERPAGTRHDVQKLAEDAKNAGKVPKIWLDCGTSDPLVTGTRELHRKLNEIGVDHIYNEYPGSHGWPYCDAHIAEAVAFHAANLGIQSQS